MSENAPSKAEHFRAHIHSIRNPVSSSVFKKSYTVSIISMTDTHPLSSTRLEKSARLLFFIAVGLLPILFIPALGLPLLFVKVTFFSLCMAVSLLLLVAATLKRGELHVPRSRFLYVACVLPCVYILAALFSQNPTVSWYWSAGIDSVFFILLCVFSFALAVLLLRTSMHIMTLLLTLLGASVLVVLFQLGVLVLGSFFSLNLFPSHSFNLVGGWNDLGVFLGLTVVITSILLQFGKRDRKEAVILGILLAASLFFLILISLNILWATLFLVALLLCVAVWVSSSLRKNLPFLIIGLALVSGVGFLVTDTVSVRIGQKLGISQIEARPSFLSTVDIAKSSYGEGLSSSLFGSGPGTFTEQWLSHKPRKVNMTPFWNSDFPAGFGTVPTAFVSTGILGGLAWLLFAGAMLVLALKLLRGARSDESVLGLAAAFGSLFLLVVSFVYPLSHVLLLLAFILGGTALAVLRLEDGRHVTLSFSGDIRSRAFLGLIVASVSLFSGFTLWKTSQLAASETFVALTARAADIDAAQVHSSRALALRRSDRTLRLATEVGVTKLNEIAAENAKDAPARFESVLRPTLDYALEAVRYNPQDYANWLSLAFTYEFLARLGVQGAYENARATYEEALARNPSSPGLYLTLARLEAFKGNYTAAREIINQALEQKPNFTEAVVFAVQMEMGRGNMKGAIQAAKASVATDPANPTLWFELGIFLYANDDLQGSRDALERTLMLVPEHANAKYFLGLAFERLGERSKALVLFEELRKANPENRELPLIISNLRLGKPPFEGAGSVNPLERMTAPLSQ